MDLPVESATLNPVNLLALWLTTAALALASATDEFIADATEKHGAFGEKAARFLVEHMPENDRKSLSAAFLSENLELALKARGSFPWGKQVPEDIFLNDVLPYAVFDEPRDPWRADFLEKATLLVKNAATATEAAQILNKEFFTLINTHYNTRRERTNQSPKESIEQGKATCTGLSIILVDVCRAVGIPARAVGTPMWSNGRGNHTWVEIWDGGWHFTGADEYDAHGLNRAWFTADAAKASATEPAHAIYATSWKKDGLSFPMIWARGNNDVAAVEITSRYAKAEPAKPLVGVRFLDGGKRTVVRGILTNERGERLATFTTKAGTADLNDMPRLDVRPGKNYRLRFFIENRLLETETFTATNGETTLDIRMADLSLVSKIEDAKETKEPALTRENAPAAIEQCYRKLVAAQTTERSAELESMSITIGGKTLKWLEKSFGKAPRDGRSLWISMHGGGGAPPAVNDQQWRNQIRLYQPKEGIYLAPRAPTDTWDLWHQGHIDPLFSRLIENMIALRGVNPDKVYLMGYSAGGDGVWQLAPRMADRFAAAAMMAGHPNESSLLGLRNLPFAIFMGGADAAYKRNELAAAKTAELGKLQLADPDAYTHISHIYKGLPHWMNGKDAEALPWMAKFSRNTWPKKIVWYQDNVTHDRFYWLQLPEGSARKDQQIIATVTGQAITLTGDVPPGTRLLLHDDFINIDQPVQVTVNARPVQRFEVTRSLAVIQESLTRRLDPKSTPSAGITLK
jgi:transglutaminase-like putative cysteine protease/pimeloyl-ACP methyl ester carboxylesterase